MNATTPPRRRRWFLRVFTIVVALAVGVAFWRPLFFITGGGLISLGHMLQEAVGGFVESGDVGTPEEVLKGILQHNQESSWVRSHSLVAHHRPVAMVVMCIDPRLDARAVMGDTRDYYDLLRLPGSVLSPEAIEAIELGVREHRVKVLLFTTHTDCSMEKVAASKEAAEFPALSNAVHQREFMYHELLKRPVIAEHIRTDDLIVRRFKIDTATDRLIPDEGSR